MSGIVIIGAGQAGSSMAVKLRSLGFQGDVTLIGGRASCTLSTTAFVQKIFTR